MHIAGNFNGWDPSAKSLANAGNGMYMATIPLVKGDTISYKFINGDSWSDPHDSVSCSSLSIQSMGNRYAVLESNIDTIGPVMLSSCTNSPVMELIQADTATACFGDSHFVYVVQCFRLSILVHLKLDRYVTIISPYLQGTPVLWVFMHITRMESVSLIRYG